MKSIEMRAQKSGALINAVPSTMNWTTLSKEEFSDNLHDNGFKPTNLLEYCDCCGEVFSVEHVLNCEKG